MEVYLQTGTSFSEHIPIIARPFILSASSKFLHVMLRYCRSIPSIDAIWLLWVDNSNFAKEHSRWPRPSWSRETFTAAKRASRTCSPWSSSWAGGTPCDSWRARAPTWSTPDRFSSARRCELARRSCRADTAEWGRSYRRLGSWRFGRRTSDNAGRQTRRRRRPLQRENQRTYSENMCPRGRSLHLKGR